MGLQILTRERVSEALKSDIEDDFDIPHIGDNTGSSSGSDSEGEPVVISKLVEVNLHLEKLILERS